MRRKRHVHHKKPAAKKAAVHKSARINGDQYLKNRVLVFKLKKQIRTELAEDKREIKNLQRFVRRARKFAA